MKIERFNEGVYLFLYEISDSGSQPLCDVSVREVTFGIEFAQFLKDNQHLKLVAITGIPQMYSYASTGAMDVWNKGYWVITEPRRPVGRMEDC